MAAQTPVPTPLDFVVAGTVSYADTVRQVPGAVVVGSAIDGYTFTTSNAAGAYSLTWFLPGTAYTVRAEKRGGQNAAITSYDAALIARYVAGLITLTPNQRLAADASGDGQITSYDAALVGNFGVSWLLAHGLAGTWQFVPANRIYVSITGDVAGENYTAILIGDVSQNWTAAAPTPWPEPTGTPIVWPQPTAMPWPSPPPPCPAPVCQ